MAETIILDAAGIAVNRTALDITQWINATGSGINFGDAEIQAYMSDAAVGSSPVDYRIPNRVIQIPLTLRTVGATTFTTIRQQLQQKAALFQREGGWIMRQIDTTPLYADVVNATLHLGGAWLQAFRSADVDAVLTLECIPDWYGDEIALSDHVETTLPHLIFTEPTVNGNHPARVRLVVDNDQATDQLGLLWGFRARNYNAGTTASLFYEAEALLPVNGAAGTALAGASGGTVVQHASLPANTWVSMLRTSMVGGTVALTHTGSYRVWARCYSASAVPQYRLQWGAGDIAVPVINDPAQVAGTANFYMLDLGGIRLDPPSVGSMQWQGVIQTQVNAANQPAMIDSIYFQPLDETAGKLTYVNKPPASSLSTYMSPTAAADDSATGTIAWSNPTNVLAEDPNYATVALTSGQTSHWLKATSYGFAIPAAATIAGIQVEVFYTTGGAGTPTFWITPRLSKASTVQSGANTVFSTGTFGPDFVLTVGGPTDLWGGAWLFSDINASGFGAAVNAIDVSSSGTLTVSVNFMRITVYYTLASGFTVSRDAVMYASRTAQLTTDGIVRQDPSGTVYGPVSNVIGDLPRIPPSGLENRTVQTFLKGSRGDFDQMPDSGIDDISARINYRPSYLVTP